MMTAAEAMVERDGCWRALRRLAQAAGLVAGGLALGLVLWLGLRGEAEIKKVGFMPQDLARYFDRNDFAKNMMGFGALRLAVAAGLAPWAWGWRGWRRNLGLSVGCVGVAVVLEVAQLGLPRRSFDGYDILAAAAGVAVVAAALGLAGAAARAAWGWCAAEASR